MINHHKWIGSLPKAKKKIIETINQLDYENSINRIPKKDSYNSVKKYSFMSILFVCGLLFVSMVKNEARNLQKEINNLETSINLIKFNLDQTLLDHEIITSPENISLRAKKHLYIDLVPYKRSQIKQLKDENENFTQINKTKKEKINNLSVGIKSHVAKKIEKKKMEIRKLHELYSDPKSIPNEIKTQVIKQVEEKKMELENVYYAPKGVITLERAGKWTVVQLVKAFLGMPIIPGR